MSNKLSVALIDEDANRCATGTVHNEIWKAVVVQIGYPGVHGFRANGQHSRGVVEASASSSPPNRERLAVITWGHYIGQSVAIQISDIGTMCRGTILIYLDRRKRAVS